MEQNLVPTTEIIRQAQQLGIDLGQGQPMHRIRYLIKIGLLPHQIRKMTAEGRVVGHLSASALAILKTSFDNKNSKLSYRRQGAGKGVLPLSSLVTTRREWKYLSSAAGVGAGLILLYLIPSLTLLASPVNDIQPPVTGIAGRESPDNLRLRSNSGSGIFIFYQIPNSNYNFSLPPTLVAANSPKITEPAALVLSSQFPISESETVFETKNFSGTAVLAGGQTEVKVTAKAVSADSVILITSRTTTNLTLSVVKVDPRKSFTVSVTTPSTQDIQFNWLISN